MVVLRWINQSSKSSADQRLGLNLSVVSTKHDESNQFKIYEDIRDIRLLSPSGCIAPFPRTSQQAVTIVDFACAQRLDCDVGRFH